MHNIVFVPGQFLSTLSLRRATPGERHANNQQEFLSTLSLRRATAGSARGISSGSAISIHALLAESDSAPRITPTASRNFYPRSPCGERPTKKKINPASQTFLSTLSLRRATGSDRGISCKMAISIHALLAESDRQTKQTYRAKTSISIHALLAESDCSGSQQPTGTTNFYPRSPCGERRFYPLKTFIILSFLSTLSLRRATSPASVTPTASRNFYPRSPCGERR